MFNICYGVESHNSLTEGGQKEQNYKLVFIAVIYKSDCCQASCQHRGCATFETQLCATYYNLVKPMDSTKTTHALILDFKKTFDKVPHILLLQKLGNIVNPGITLMNWIQEFLTRRTQKVVVNGQASSICDVASGVPQGSETYLT